MISYSCPKCKTFLTAIDGDAGSKVQCPKCGQRLQIPRPPAPVNKTVLGTLEPNPAPVARHAPPPPPLPQADFVAELVEPSTGFPDFFYTYLFSHRRVSFEVDRAGILTGLSKSVKTSVSGGGGAISSDSYGHVQGWINPISTTHETTMELWIQDAEGRESSVIIKKDIPLREGHQVSVVGVQLEGGGTYCYCLVLNHTAGETYFLRRSYSTVTPSVAEGLGVGCLAIVCFMVCVANQPAGMLTGMITCCVAIFYLVVRGVVLCRRFDRHCDGIVRRVPCP